MINCFKDSIHVLMSVLLCTNGDDAHQEVVDHVASYVNDVVREEEAEEEEEEEDGVDVVDAKEDKSLSGGDTLTLESSLRKKEVDSNSTEENGDVVDAKEDESLSGEDTLTLKSSLRKEVDSNSSEADSKRNKKKVHWVDLMGIKELAEIRVFELSEEDYMDSNRGRTCECVIL